MLATEVSTSARFVIPIPSSARDAVLRGFLGEELGRWDVSHGRELVIDFLDPAVCTVDGHRAPGPGVAEDFVAYPRMTVLLDGTAHELVSGHPEVLRRHYNRPQHGAIYWGPQSEPDPYVQAFHKGRLAQIARLMRGVRGRVLDVGSGHTMLHLVSLPDVQIYACDRDPEPVHAMRERGMAVSIFASADAVPFKADTFDALFAGEIVEHLVHPHEAVRQWVELLRPGGRLVITTPNRTHIMARLLHREKVVNAEHLFEWSSAELLAAVRGAGADVVRHEGLILALPVPVPFKGWRDVIAGIHRRRGRPLPEWLLRIHVEAGRPFPTAAANMAVVAIKTQR
jgi:2-polyprenyl-3-methyl-5-hydroxy-6-metoxy-1,4-benzoquinol methylase